MGYENTNPYTFKINKSIKNHNIIFQLVSSFFSSTINVGMRFTSAEAAGGMTIFLVGFLGTLARVILWVAGVEKIA